MFIDIHCSQRKKHGQHAFGDCFLSRRKSDEGRLIAVLSDGLGSGIKAGILASMTSAMLLRFVEEHFDIQKASEIIMNSLPVCRVRKISYATFSAVECDEDGSVRIVEEGNPDFIFMRGTEPRAMGFNIVVSDSFPDRRMKIYQFKVNLGDRLIFFSDGVSQAGLGEPGPFHQGLGREGLTEIIRTKIRAEQSVSSQSLADYIVRRAEAMEPDGLSKDDISACVIYFRDPRRSLVFTGPPYDQSKDAFYAALFDKFEGRKAICGGSTAKLIARELGRPLTLDQPGKARPAEAPADADAPAQAAGIGSKNSFSALPPAASMPGVDLITEGVLTLARALDYLEKNELEHDDAAGRLIEFFLQSDIINFMVGARQNPVHMDPAQPVEMEFRKNVVKRMRDILENRYLKKVRIRQI